MEDKIRSWRRDFKVRGEGKSLIRGLKSLRRGLKVIGGVKKLEVGVRSWSWR